MWGGGGGPTYKKDGAARQPLAGWKAILVSLSVQPRKIHSGSFCSTFLGYWAKKNMAGNLMCVFLKLVSIGGEIFLNFRRESPSFSYGCTPPPRGGGMMFVLKFLQLN